MELKRISTNTTWENAVNGINGNSTKISEAIMRLQNSYVKNKGYFKTEEQLVNAHPTPSEGLRAYVGVKAPFKIYVSENGSWVDSGIEGGDESVNLEGYFTKEEWERLVKDMPQEEFDQLREDGLLDVEVTYNTYEE